MKAILAKMTIDDLPNGNLRELARQIGISKVKELMIKCPGMVLYIPKCFSTRYYRRYIELHWEGNNAEQLARDLGVTTMTIYRHLNAKL